MRLTGPVPGLLCLLAAPLAAQSNAERMANDGYSRSHDYDLVHERIELGDFDWDSLAFTGRVAITLRALRPAFDAVILDAGPLLDMRAVAAAGRAGGTPLRFEHTGDTLVNHLERPAAFGDTVRLSIDYHARIKSGEGLTFIEADTAPPRRPRQLWSQGEGEHNHAWFPTYDFPNDRATWELVATVPAGYTAVSNGRLLADSVHRDGSRTMDWQQDRPAATYLVSLIVAPLARVRDTWRGRPVDYYVYRPDSSAARRLFGVTPDMIEVYSRLTGVEYPWPKYAQTTVADFFGGMENVTATTLVDWIPDARAYADRPWFRQILIPHELAHQWFGDYVTPANWANIWLSEGFAEFMPGQYWAARLGRPAEDEYYLDEYRQYLTVDQRRRMPVATLGSNNIYPKGALVLRMLQRYLGPERFWAGVKRYLTDHALGLATTDDLRQAFLAATGENLDWFWDQWLYQAGHPDLVVTAAWDSASGTLALAVRQTQPDSATADSTGLRFAVPAAFRMPVTVWVGTALGDVRQQVSLDRREQSFTIAGVRSPPTMVVFDSGNVLLKTLTFEQPTAWLANQLARDPDLWNRAWVIDRLAVRKGDAEALAALTRAATGADHFSTRALATTALGAWDGAAAHAALLRAAGDTSAIVRAAAFGGLGRFADSGVVAVVRRAWEGDSSYAVRAAALGSLAGLDPANAAALIRRGLATPSYQGVIGDAAVSAAYQLGDPSLLDDVSAAVETSDDAGFLLGAIGARGDARAFDLLEGHLASPRRTVRRRVLRAFQLAVPPEIARERLRAAAAAAGDPRVRGEIEATLARLLQ